MDWETTLTPEEEAALYVSSIRRQLPQWQERPEVQYNFSPTKPPKPNEIAYVQPPISNEVNVYPNAFMNMSTRGMKEVIGHEYAHTRQVKHGLKSDPVLSGYLDQIQEVVAKQKEPVFKSSNWRDNRYETFANLETYVIDHMNQGIQFKDTRLGRLVGADLDPEMNDYIQKRVLIGIPSLYEAQPEGQTFRERIGAGIDALKKQFGFSE